MMICYFSNFIFEDKHCKRLLWINCGFFRMELKPELLLDLLLLTLGACNSEAI